MGPGLWIMGYGRLTRFPCEQSPLKPKSMGYDRLWVIAGMGYDRFDCTVPFHSIRRSHVTGLPKSTKCHACPASHSPVLSRGYAATDETINSDNWSHVTRGDGLNEMVRRTLWTSIEWSARCSSPTTLIITSLKLFKVVVSGLFIADCYNRFTSWSFKFSNLSPLYSGRSLFASLTQVLWLAFFSYLALFFLTYVRIPLTLYILKQSHSSYTYYYLFYVTFSKAPIDSGDQYFTECGLINTQLFSFSDRRFRVHGQH